MVRAVHRSDEGADIGELMRITGMSRPTLYRHLAQHAKAGRSSGPLARDLHRGVSR